VPGVGWVKGEVTGDHQGADLLGLVGHRKTSDFTASNRKPFKETGFEQGHSTI